ncbi:MAG TPA: hypothetical protein VK705_06065 [Ferruginibacter sp.]|jgi:hypothetical protein|nr:hypothetical protein [Ferruginibacter sp.]
MKKIILLTVVLVVTFTIGFVERASAQYYYYDDNTYDTPLTFEAGASLGTMNCLTDIGGNAGLGKKGLKDYRLGNTDFDASIYASAVYKYAYGLRLEATYGTVSASDADLKSVASSTDGRYQRNLSFRSRIEELALVAEFYPLYIFVDWANTKYDPPKLSPYILAGVGVFHFNPQAQDSLGNWVDLQPLHTEGEGIVPGRPNYKLTQINFPVGFGLKYELTPKINIRAELMWRILQTDYLDDVSTTYVDPSVFKNNLPPAQAQEAIYFSDRVKNSPSTPQYNWHVGGIRGDSKNNDTYFSLNIKVGIAFGREAR